MYNVPPGPFALARGEHSSRKPNISLRCSSSQLRRYLTFPSIPSLQASRNIARMPLFWYSRSSTSFVDSESHSPRPEGQDSKKIQDTVWYVWYIVNTTLFIKHFKLTMYSPLHSNLLLAIFLKHLLYLSSPHLAFHTSAHLLSSPPLSLPPLWPCSP